eukprot:scaffold73155_cov33-Phaeocystis_antarctica.AAC.1
MAASATISAQPAPATLTLVLPRSSNDDRSAPRARDSHQLVVCTRPQAQIVGLWVFSSRP